MARLFLIWLVLLLVPLAAAAQDCDGRVSVTKERLVAMYRDAILKQSPWMDKGEIIIEGLRTPLNLTVPERDKETFQAKFAPNEDFLGFTTLTLSFGADASVKATLGAIVRVVAEVPVAKTEIRRGALIGEQDLELKKVDITQYPPLAINIPGCVGMRAKSWIRKGLPVLLTNIDVPPLVAKGEAVFIEASGDNLQVMDRGMALMDGRLDQKIAVRNMTSGRQIIGTVIAPSRIRVDF